MGTRSLTVFKDEHGEEMAVMYRQYDGYPEGHGMALAEFLSGKAVVNGIPMGMKEGFNGPGCLAAQVVAHFKDDIGDFYLYGPNTRDIGEEFIYTITANAGMKEPSITFTETWAWSEADSEERPASEWLILWGIPDLERTA